MLICFVVAIEGIKKIDRNAYEHFIANHFGVEMVDELLLCNMHEKQHDGFYKIEATHKLVVSTTPSTIVTDSLAT